MMAARVFVSKMVNKKVDDRSEMKQELVMYSPIPTPRTSIETTKSFIQEPWEKWQ